MRPDYIEIGTIVNTHGVRGEMKLAVRDVEPALLRPVKTLYIDDLCVDENKRGMHIGKTLYGAVLDFARAHGCYNVTLNVWSCNESAMKFYQACGLKPQKVGMEVIL